MNYARGSLGICDWGFCVYPRSTSACPRNDAGPDPMLRTESSCAKYLNFAVARRHLPSCPARRARNIAPLQRPGLTASRREIALPRIAVYDRIVDPLTGTLEPQDTRNAP